KRVSRPGQRHYVGHTEIPKVLGGMGTAIVSTSRGVMTGHEARDAGVGGEVVEHDGEELLVKRPTDRGEHRALHGLTRSLVANMVEGVTAGFEKRLEIQGV